MKKLLTVVLAAALCAPAFAQKMGSSNSNAPMVTQTIAIGDAKMSLDYTSITWATGATMGRIMDKENGAKARTRVNDTASKAPLGTFKTSIDVTIGELAIPAGDYQVFFTVGDDLAWSINFMGKDGKTLTSKLTLANSDHDSKRLLLCLYAGDDEGAGVYVAFGKQSGMLAIKPAKKQ